MSGKGKGKKQAVPQDPQPAPQILTPTGSEATQRKMEAPAKEDAPHGETLVTILAEIRALWDDSAQARQEMKMGFENMESKILAIPQSMITDWTLLNRG